MTKNSVDCENFKDLAQITGEVGIDWIQNLNEPAENDKSGTCVKGKGEKSIGKQLLVKKDDDEEEEEEEEEEPEQLCRPVMKLTVYGTGELGTTMEELPLVGPFDRTRGNKGCNEEEGGDNEKYRGTEFNEENECGCSDRSESRGESLMAVAGAIGIDNTARHTCGPCGSENKTSPIKNEQKDVKIVMDDDLGDVNQADSFHSKDLLCFAWQIAKGMVSTARE